MNDIDGLQWLNDIQFAKSEKGEGGISKIVSDPPLDLMLDGCLFYPASGLDFRPIRIYGIQSAVYVDYYFEQNEIEDRVTRGGLRGYDILGIEDVDLEVLVPDPFNPDVSGDNLVRAQGFSSPIEGRIKPAFAKWIVFERRHKNRRSDSHSRISLLYICAEAIAIFQQLFVSRKICPDYVAIIRPGTGFGGNWTDFREEEGLLGQSVRSVANDCTPQFLISDWEGGYWPEMFPHPSKSQAKIDTKDRPLYLTVRSDLRNDRCQII